MAIAHVKDIDIYFEIHGSGPPLVLIMGLRRNAEWWYRQIPELSKHFTVIAFDNRGAGRSDKPEMEYSIRLFADDTAELMNFLEIPRAHILGVSMGGYIAQELAINYPDKVNGLILGCTSCGGRRAVMMPNDRMEKFKANKGLTPEQILRKDMDLLFSDRFVQEQPEWIEEFVSISLRYYQPADAFFRQLDACLKHDTVDRVSEISSATMIMTGDDDLLVPSENSLILKELMPAADLELFAGCRHCFFLEESATFNNSVVRFFQSVR
ncbi:MAG: alpha/beta fold hydrolase [Desulfomonile tiedjei]|nr:alpha/beta fold hydrolase [Desulfomonile tiedjei]